MEDSRWVAFAKMKLRGFVSDWGHKIDNNNNIAFYCPPINRWIDMHKMPEDKYMYWNTLQQESITCKQGALLIDEYIAKFCGLNFRCIVKKGRFHDNQS